MATTPLAFETLNVAGTGRPLVERARVPGGWLVIVEAVGFGDYSTFSVCFYPDPGHEWDGGSLDEDEGWDED